jgi:hypothetical protein
MAKKLSIQQIIDDDFFDAAECGIDIKVTTRTLERWAKLGIGPPVTWLRKRPFYEKSAVAAWKKSREKTRAKTVRAKRT